MAAVTEAGAVLTEFAGANKVFAAKITPAADGDTLTVEEFSTITAVVLTKAATPGGANSNIINVATVSGNVITIKTYKADGTTAATVWEDIWAVVIGS